MHRFGRKRLRWNLSLVVLLGAACTSAGEDDGSAAAAPQVAVSPDATEVPDWDALREQERQSYAEAFMAATGLDEVPDDVEFVEYISLDAYGAVIAACMAEEGWEVRESFDGGVTYGHVPPDQAIAQNESIYRCHVQYPVHPRYSLPMDDEQLRILYDHYVDNVTPCLQAEGVTVEPAPTWETFAEQHRAEELTWQPFSQELLDTVGWDEWQRLYSVCPPMPSPEELYGQAPGGG